MRAFAISATLFLGVTVPAQASRNPSDYSDDRILRLEKTVAELRIIVSELQDRLAVALQQRSSQETPKPSTAVSGAPSSSGTYRVKQGDSLWRIAKRNGISVSALKRANSGLNPRKLRIGALVNIPGSGVTQATVRDHQPRATSPSGGSSYKIKRGDTLGHIAQRYGLSSRDLLAINPGLNPRRLLIGKSISIPGVREKSQPAPSPQHRIQPEPPQVVHYHSPSQTQADEPVKLVKVSEQRSMGYLAALYQTDVATLNRLNEVDFPSYKMVRVGSEIYVPSH